MMTHEGETHNTTHIVNVPLFLLVRLKYIQELFICVVIVRVTGFNLVEILDCMVEFTSRLFANLIPAIEISKERSSGRCLWVLEPWGIRWIKRWLGVEMECVRCQRAR